MNLSNSFIEEYPFERSIEDFEKFFPANASFNPALQAGIGPYQSFQYRVLKRALDILLSMMIIIFILSWLMPILIILTFWDLGAPIFFVQKRIGHNNQCFNCLKLRTMYKTSKNPDMQVSKLGQWLRLHKLDELPQFVNVIRGEMSIVGPRPHMLSDHVSFTEIIGKHYQFRHTVLPGITGLAQVSGFEGPITSSKSLKGRIGSDFFYIKQWSMVLDIKIMFQTIKHMIRGHK